MGEITDALRRAQNDGVLEKRTSRDALPVDEERRLRDREHASPLIDSSREDSADSKPSATDLPRDGGVTKIVVPRSKTGFWQPRAVVLDPPMPEAECFRHLAVRVSRKLEQGGQRSVMVTSAMPQEGKTTVCCNLALAIASMAGGRRTALVDLDLHRCSVRGAFEVRPLVGFERVLSGEASLEAARIETDIPGLDIYPAARPLREAHELISGPRFKSAVDLLTSRYDKVVFDAPPVLPVPDVALAANHIASYLVVTRQGVTRQRLYRELLCVVPHAEFLGAFLNDTRNFRGGRQYEYYVANSAEDSENAEGSE
jgi:capsular exopolysaccharide synthesis family protein